MSSNKTQKWSSSVSLTKIFSRLSRTLSFSSKKNKNLIQPSQPIPKKSLSAPKSVPVIRRLPPQPISKVIGTDDIIQRNLYQQDVHVNMFEESDDEDYSRYSLRPNLSLFNVSMDNLHQQSEEYYQQVPQQQDDWINDVLHSTKIEHY